MNPKTTHLSALEKNIAKFRALELVLLLFRVEQFKRSVIEAIRATDRLHGSLQKGNPRATRLPLGTKQATDRALSILVEDGVFTKAEKVEIVKLIDYRNKAAHQVESLMHDLGAARFRGAVGGSFNYRYEALAQIDAFQRRFDKAQGYVRVVNVEHAGFVYVEDTLVAELAKLRKKIDAQWKKRKESMA